MAELTDGPMACWICSRESELLLLAPAAASRDSIVLVRRLGWSRAYGLYSPSASRSAVMTSSTPSSSLSPRVSCLAFAWPWSAGRDRYDWPAVYRALELPRLHAGGRESQTCALSRRD